MSEVISATTSVIIGTVVGVFLAWWVQFLTNSATEQKRQRTITKAIKNELEIIKDTLSNAEEFSYGFGTETQQRAVEDTKWPFITETYADIKVDLASFINHKALATIQRTYVEIQKLNESGRTVANCSSHQYDYEEIKPVIDLITESLEMLKKKNSFFNNFKKSKLVH